MLLAWIAVELFFVAFFAYGYVIYRRRAEEYKRNDAAPASSTTNAGDDTP
jgi:hypothetical protein